MVRKHDLVSSSWTRYCGDMGIPRNEAIILAGLDQSCKSTVDTSRIVGVARRTPTTPRRRRSRRAGESFVGCLFLIALVMGGSIWGYFKFVQNRPLVKAGHNHTVSKDSNREAELAYTHRMRTTHFNQMLEIRGELSTFFLDTIKKKKYAADKAGFEQKDYELVQRLRDHVEDFDSLVVPQIMNAAHVKISHSHKTFYEALVMLSKGYYEEKADQARDYKEAMRLLNAGWREDLDGENQARTIMASGAI
jgi:hypothetical protein